MAQHRSSVLLLALLLAGCFRYVPGPTGDDAAVSADASALDRATHDLSIHADARLDEGLVVPDAAQADLRVFKKVSTYAGSVAGHEDGTLAEARFKRPHHLVVGQMGDVYLTDRGNHAIRCISGGKVTTVAGTPAAAGYQDGPAASAKFREPDALFLDGDKLYISEAVGVRVRVLDLKTGQVSTLAGSGEKGFKDGAADVARFDIPKGLAVVGGKVYVADYYNHRIRVIAGGKVTTLSGDGNAGGTDGTLSQARFHNPHSLALTAGGRLLVADKVGQRIRRIDLAAGTVTTLAGGAKGTQNGACGAARFHGPSGLVESPPGRIIVADHYNRRIRIVDLAGCAVDTLAGSGVQGMKDGDPQKAQFQGPEGVAIDALGRLLVADTDGHRIRLVE